MSKEKQWQIFCFHCCYLFSKWRTNRFTCFIFFEKDGITSVPTAVLYFALSHWFLLILGHGGNQVSPRTRNASIYVTSSRQFSFAMMRRPKRSMIKRMFQISLILLTIMAFGTFVMSAIMRNVRSNSIKSEPTANKIVINMVRPAAGTLQQQASTDEAWTWWMVVKWNL